MQNGSINSNSNTRTKMTEDINLNYKQNNQPALHGANSSLQSMSALRISISALSLSLPVVIQCAIGPPHVCMRVYVCMYLCMYMSASMYAFAYVCIFECMYAYLCMHVFLYAYVCACMC